MQKKWDDTKLDNGSVLTVGPFHASVFWIDMQCHVAVMGQQLGVVYYDTEQAKLAAEQNLYLMLTEALEILSGIIPDAQKH